MRGAVMCLAASRELGGFFIAAVGLAGASVAVWQRVQRIRAQIR